MKNFKVLFLVCAIAFGLATANAQAPYKHSIGVTLGSLESFTWKTFPTDHFAIQLDGGVKFTTGPGAYEYKYSYEGIHNKAVDKHIGVTTNTVEVNANFVYQGNFVKGLYGFIGGGPSLGYCYLGYARYHDSDYFGYYGTFTHDGNEYGKFGVNAMLGLEYKFDIPLTLQFDVRPGYGMLFTTESNNGYHHTGLWHYFDWGVNFGVRYCFH